MKKTMYFVIAIVMSFMLMACEQETKTAEDKVKEQTSKIYSLNADERNLAKINSASYFDREWIQAGNKRGQHVSCRPSDSNFNGLVSCTGMMPQANGTYVEEKRYCGYRPELVGCSDEDTVK